MALPTKLTLEVVTPERKILSETVDEVVRNYPVRQMPTTEAAIHTMVSGDLYAVIGDPKGDGGYVTRIYFNPLVAWMWVRLPS